MVNRKGMRYGYSWMILRCVRSRKYVDDAVVVIGRSFCGDLYDVVRGKAVREFDWEYDIQ